MFYTSFKQPYAYLFFNTNSITLDTFLLTVNTRHLSSRHWTKCWDFSMTSTSPLHSFIPFSNERPRGSSLSSEKVKITRSKKLVFNFNLTTVSAIARDVCSRALLCCNIIGSVVFRTRQTLFLSCFKITCVLLEIHRLFSFDVIRDYILLPPLQKKKISDN